MKTRVILIFICFLLNSCQDVYPELISNKNHNNKKWFNLMLNSKKIGYFSFHSHTETKNHEKFIVHIEESFMKFKRQHNISSTKTYSLKKMDHSGKLLYFKYHSQQSYSDYEIEGNFNYEYGDVKITHKRNEQQSIEKLDIIKDTLTEYQALMKFKTKGWVIGDSITYTNLMIEKGSYIKVTMILKEKETRFLNEERKELYKIVRTIKNLPGIQSITWIDANLIPHKGELIFPNFKYSLEEVSKEEALRSIDHGLVSFEMARIRLITSLTSYIEKYRNKISSTVLLLKSMKGNNFSHELDGGLQQKIDGDLKNGIKIAIHTDIPEDIKKVPILPQNESLYSYLKPNNYIESDNKKIIDLCKHLKVKDSCWVTVLRIKNWVHDNIRVSFKTGLASALEVLTSGEGDCTEHSVLTAALCRACGIPTRLAFGYNLSFDSDMAPVYIGHMWNEVFIEDIWIPIDSTSSEVKPDPFRIRFFSSSLEKREIMEKIALFALSQNIEIKLLSISPKISNN